MVCNNSYLMTGWSIWRRAALHSPFCLEDRTKVIPVSFILTSKNREWALNCVKAEKVRWGWDSHNGQYDGHGSVCCNIVYFRKALRFRGTYRLHLQDEVSQTINHKDRFLLVPCFDYSSKLMTEAICFSESSGYFRTTPRYNSDDRTIRNGLCSCLPDNQKISIYEIFWLHWKQTKNRRLYHFIIKFVKVNTLKKDGNHYRSFPCKINMHPLRKYERQRCSWMDWEHWYAVNALIPSTSSLCYIIFYFGTELAWLTRAKTWNNRI
jgi:hypothetical protein